MHSGGKNAIPQHQLEEVKHFIENVPTLLFRNNTTAIFLAPDLNLLLAYDLYKDKSENQWVIQCHKKIPIFVMIVTNKGNDECVVILVT